MVWVLNVIKHFYHTYPHMINLILHQSILCKRAATVIWNFMCFKPRFSLGKWWGSHRNITHKGATTITKWSFFPTRPHDIHVCGNSWTTRIHQKTSNRLCVRKKNDAKRVKITWHDELCRENDPHLSICRSDTFIYLRNIATFHGLLHSQTAQTWVKSLRPGSLDLVRPLHPDHGFVWKWVGWALSGISDEFWTTGP